ncbi:MAG: dienelactone hydrolase family protein [Alphaproteobacteria bacterium]
MCGSLLRASFMALLVLIAVDGNAYAIGPGPQGTPKKQMQEQIHGVPSGVDGQGNPWLMVTTVYRPTGEGPWPLVIINHGSPGPRTRFTSRAQARWFLHKGYVVALPTRRGYGDTGGVSKPDAFSCNNPDYILAGMETAWDIKATLDYMRQLPYVDSRSTLLVGQSAGGWGVIAASGQNWPDISGIINFAGGRGGHRNCQVQNMIGAAGHFGKTSRVPSLWIYTENDSFFPPSESRPMYEEFKRAGGNAEYVLMPSFGKDGHKLFARGISIWERTVESFLTTLKELPLPPDETIDQTKND